MKKIDQLKTKQAKLEKEIANLNNFIRECPNGRLGMRANKKDSWYYYLREKEKSGKTKETYLGKERMPLAVALAKKEYAAAQLKDKLYEKQFVEKQLADMIRKSETEQLLLKKPGLASLVLPELKQRNDIPTQWRNADYIRSCEHPEHLTIPTIIPDLFVRSKSESMIVTSFVDYDVPFRYEEEHHFGNIVLHPDFTCLNPRTHEIFYLEHLGKIDDPEYINNWRNREDLYRKAGIYLWKNLLVTTETKDQPFDVRWLHQMIEHYLI